MRKTLYINSFSSICWLRYHAVFAAVSENAPNEKLAKIVQKVAGQTPGCTTSVSVVQMPEPNFLARLLKKQRKSLYVYPLNVLNVHMYYFGFPFRLFNARVSKDTRVAFNKFPDIFCTGI